MMLPGLRDAQIVAGAGGLDRGITGLKVLEAPETLRFVTRGDLVLTMGFALRGDRQAQVEIVDELARSGSAGLVLRPEPYLGKVPVVMAQRADASALPLLAISRHVAYEDVALPILQRLTRGREAHAQQSVEIGRRFTQLVLDRAGASGVVQALSETICGVAVLADPDANVVFSHASAGFVHSAERAWSGGAPEESVELESLAGHLRLEIGPRDVSRVAAPGMPADWIVAPVLAGGGERLGYVCVVPDQGFPEDLASAATEQAARVIALELLKDREVAAAEHRLRGHLVDDLLSGSYGAESDILRRARYLRYDLPAPHVPLLVVIDEFARRVRERGYDQLQATRLRDRFLSMVTGIVQREHPSHLVTSRCFQAIFLLPLRPDSQDAGSVRQLAERILRAVKNSDLGLTASVAIGRTCVKPADFRQALIDVQRTLDLMIKLGKCDHVVVYDRLGVYRLLALVEDRAGLDAFAQQLLGPLANYDRVRGTPFLKTLEVYLRCHGNLMRTARELHIHLNTVRYRLSRISDIAGIDLRDEDARLDLLLALRIRAILGQD
jgi:purine catabolism regulator